jgi:hypothetical protein
MLEDSPPFSARRPSISLDDGGAPVLLDAEDGELSAAGRPIVLTSFVRRADQPATYRWSIAFSIVAHVVLIGLSLWFGRAVILPRLEPVAVLLRSRPPRPPPPAREAKQEALRKGGRGISLPKAVAKDIQPEEELSFASQTEPATSGHTGRWVGGVGDAIAQGPGWADGVESGAVLRRSLSRDPQPIHTAWDCDFLGEPEGKVIVGVRVHVSDSGRVMHVTVIRGGPAIFNAAAIECAMRERFRPALDVNGNPCERDGEVDILFFRTGHAFAKEPPPPKPAAPAPPPLVGPQPDLPVQLDETPEPGDAPSTPTK